MASEKPQEPRRWACDYVIDILRALDIRYILAGPGPVQSRRAGGSAVPQCSHWRVKHHG